MLVIPAKAGMTILREWRKNSGTIESELHGSADVRYNRHGKIFLVLNKFLCFGGSGKTAAVVVGIQHIQIGLQWVFTNMKCPGKAQVKAMGGWLP